MAWSARELGAQGRRAVAVRADRVRVAAGGAVGALVAVLHLEGVVEGAKVRRLAKVCQTTSAFPEKYKTLLRASKGVLFTPRRAQTCLTCLKLLKHS